MSTLNNGARSNGRDKDEKQNIFVNMYSNFYLLMYLYVNFK